MRPRPASVFRRLLRDDSGAAAIMMALALPVVVGMLAMGVETGLWFAERRGLQSAADAAALSGAFEVQAGRTTSVTTAAKTDAALNSFSVAEGSTITVNYPPLSGSYVGDTRSVEVTVTRKQSLLFSALFMSSLTVSARAVARASQPGDYCIIALDRAQSSALDLNGSTDITLSGCGIFANSSDEKALTISGSAKLIADFIEVVGGYDVSGAATMSVGSATTGARTIRDPYRHQQFPTAASSCESGKFKNTETISPGTYCEFNFNAGANVTLEPGVYVIDGGDFLVNGGAQLQGTGVTIVLTGSGSDWAEADIRGGAIVDLSAPTSGTYSGMVLMQDRDAPATVKNKMNGGSTTSFTGVVYFPNQELEFTGGNDTGSGCTHIVANLVTFTGNADLGNACTNAGITGGATQPPRLVE